MISNSAYSSVDSQMLCVKYEWQTIGNFYILKSILGQDYNFEESLYMLFHSLIIIGQIKFTFVDLPISPIRIYVDIPSCSRKVFKDYLTRRKSTNKSTN